MATYMLLLNLRCSPLPLRDPLQDKARIDDTTRVPGLHKVGLILIFDVECFNAI